MLVGGCEKRMPSKSCFGGDDVELLMSGAQKILKKRLHPYTMGCLYKAILA